MQFCQCLLLFLALHPCFLKRFLLLDFPHEFPCQPIILIAVALLLCLRPSGTQPRLILESNCVCIPRFMCLGARVSVFLAKNILHLFSIPTEPLFGSSTSFHHHHCRDDSRIMKGVEGWESNCMLLHSGSFVWQFTLFPMITYFWF